MVPVQVILLAMVIGAYLTSEGGARPLPARPGMILLTVVASHVLLVMLIWQGARRRSRLLHEPEVNAARLASGMERMVEVARWATVLLAGVQVWGLGWGALVMQDRQHGGWGLANLVPLPALIFFLPPVLSWAGFWTASYQVDRAMHERALAYRMAQGLPVHEMPSLGHYLLLKMRLSFYLLVPVLAAMVVERVSRLWSPAGWAQAVVAGGGAVLLFLSIPWMITRLWGTEPLTGPLRARLDAVAARYRLRFRNVLLWRTHHHVSNAAILGFVPWLRYFLLSDALIETLDDRQIEAVFAHEVGHGHHRHVWWYIAAVAGSMLLAMEVAMLAEWGVESLRWKWLAGHAPWVLTTVRSDEFQLLFQLVLMGLFFVVGFSWISRRFEHQADWFAARHMAGSLAREPRPALREMTLEEYVAGVTAAPAGAEGLVQVPTGPAEVKTGEAEGEEGGEGNLLAGAEAFSSGLRQIVTLANRSLDRGGWLHPSPNRRAELLRAMARSPEVVRQFQRDMVRVRVVIVLLLAAGVGGWLVLDGLARMGILK